ncbi:MAG TPA: RNA-binding protein [Planctomycetota bacterium]|nr:RNA-binding protein [Planctomycetota bacterium]
MANKNLFQTLFGARQPVPDTRNESGGPAWSLSNEQALALFAATGCLEQTFYATGKEQLEAVLALANACEPRFVAQTAVFAREQGCMKDLPALLCAVLAVRDGALLASVFPRVIDSGKMLRNFVQIVRSGQVGRKSLGTLPRRLVRDWFAARSEQQLFDASIGASPSLADIVKMVHPKPATPARGNLYAYLIGKPFDASLLPAEVQQFELFKLGVAALPDISFQFLSALPLDEAQWRTIAQRASWTTLRLNLNTFQRHGVFACAETTALLAARLGDAEQVRRAKAFPYQIMTTLFHLDAEIPAGIRQALTTALDLSTANVPTLPGRTVVAVDISGSMQSPVTGHRKGSTTAATCLDTAALFAAAILRQNPGATVIPFHDRVCDVVLDASAPVLTTSAQLRALPSGGTNCSAVLALLNQRRESADTVIYLSDNQSWVDAGQGTGTAMLAEWRRFKHRNRAARLVCIDLQPYRTVQAPVADDVVHVGGFSDQVFEVLRTVAERDRSPDLWVDRIRKVAI